MFCEHGFIRENCPHCQSAIGIKPLVRLVEPAPREIPIPVARKKEFLGKKIESMEPLFEPQQSIRSIPNRPVRTFDLRKAPPVEINPLFAQRRQKMRDKEKTDEILHNSELKPELQDIKKQFLK